MSATLSVIEELSTANLFVTYNEGIFLIAPTLLTKTGKYAIKITI